MSFFKGKFESLSNIVSDAVSSGKEALIEAKEKTVDYSKRVADGVTDVYSVTKDKAGEVADSTANSNFVVSSKEHLSLLSDGTKAKYLQVSASSSAFYDSSSQKVKGYASFSAEKVSTYFSRTMEVDKDTDQIISEVRSKLPVRPQDVDHIFEQTKQEALRRAIASFCLAPVMTGLDKANEAKYSNLSIEYKDFKKENNLHDHKNFADMNDGRVEARKTFQWLPNGYDTNANNTLDPWSTDIEHIIPKNQIYNDLLLRIATNDDSIVDAINFKQNLIYADDSLNGSKSDRDLIAYIERYGRRDPNDPDTITFIIGEDNKEVTISEKDALEKYEKAQEQLASIRMQALKEIGLSIADAGARMAAQQVVGVIVSETVDIFVDEIKDITQKGLITDKQGVLKGLDERRISLSAKLSARFEERNIMQQAKTAGIEGGVAGALSAIPQILISMLVKLPALVLSIIRECTLSTVRCVRVMISDATDKYEQISIVLFGAASTVIGLYVANTLSKALMGVPLLNLFSHSVADVLTGALITAIPLAAIYVFDQNKAKLLFRRVDVEPDLSSDTPSEPEPLPA
jgi:hypothetical protein